MTFIGELRRYQQDASDLVTTRGRVLLALDLGTGKTIVSLHAIEKLREEGKVKCAVLIMSSSLTKQWEKRIQQFTDATSVVLVDGSVPPKKREIILSEAIEERPEYLIIGIRQAVTNLGFISALTPELILVDEVTSIKNFGSQQSKAIKKMISPYRIGLTAEPIENGKAEELFSIMQWIDPQLFGSWQSFEEQYVIRNQFNMITGYKNTKQLNSILMTACVNKRRTDPGVAEFMPTVEEFNVLVEMDDGIRGIYTEIARELLHALYSSDGGGATDVGNYYAGTSAGNSNDSLGPITSKLLALHLLLDSPRLLEESGRRYADPADPRGSRYASELLQAGRVPTEGVLGAKMEACVELCQEFLEENPEHKVIVFARFKGVLPLLAEQLDNYGSVFFTGDLNSKQRGEAIERFTNDPDIRLFLSSDAGGYGVDLYTASHLINYDLPNSSGVFKQRNGRHVRASSTFRHVYIYNLIVAGTVEEYQLSRLSYKSKVANAVVGGVVSGVTDTVENEGKSLTKFLEDYLGGKR